MVNMFKHVKNAVSLGFFIIYKKRNLKTIMKDLDQQKHVVVLFFVLCFFNFNFWNPNYPSTT